MTKEEATKILARMLEKDANGADPNDTSKTFFGAYFAPDERSAIIYALQDMNGKPEKPKAQPIYITDNGKIIPLPEPDPPKTWISAAKITEEIKRIVKETVAAERREERRLFEMTRDIVEAEAELCRMINANIDARITHFLELERERKEGAKND